MRYSLLVTAHVFLARLVAGAEILNADAENAVPGSYIVVFKEGSAQADVDSHMSLVEEMSTGEVSYYSVGFDGYHANIADEDLEAILNDPLVDFVEKDVLVSVSSPMLLPDHPMPRKREAGYSKCKPHSGGYPVPDPDPKLVTQLPAEWGLARISHREKGQEGYVADGSYGEDVKVYIIDSGIRLDHEEFEGRALFGANFIGTEGDTDLNGHGTHVAGTVTGKTYGVAKKAIPISVKVIGGSGNGPTTGVIAGMEFAYTDAEKYGRDKVVVNMSVGGPFLEAQNLVAKKMVEAGMTVVVAAGNNDVDASGSSPSSEPSVLTVAASDINDARASFSNWGPVVDLFAPGLDIKSAWSTGPSDTAVISGTSMASPHVAGLAAYLIKLEGLSGPAVAARILAVATPDKISDTKGSPNLLAYNNSGK